VTEEDLPPQRRAPYYVAVRRGWLGEEWQVYPMPLRQPLPRIPIPLRRSDADVGLDLQPLIDRVYAAGAHDDIDHAKPPLPPLDDADAAWAAELLNARPRPAT
jgi:hypothetical protein